MKFNHAGKSISPLSPHRKPMHSNPYVAELNRKIPTLTSMSKLNRDDIIDDKFTVEGIEIALKKKPKIR